MTNEIREPISPKKYSYKTLPPPYSPLASLAYFLTLGMVTALMRRAPARTDHDDTTTAPDTVRRGRGSRRHTGLSLVAASEEGGEGGKGEDNATCLSATAAEACPRT